MSGVRYTQEQYEQLLRDMRATKADNRVAVPPADAKSDVQHALASAVQAISVDKKFRVRVHTIGKRLADTDGNSIKAVFDGITAAGIWPDDSSKFIQEICFTQEVGKKDQTIIEIIEEEAR
jgi:Holliday junction resolvase RusA-like endonuclease